MNVKIVNYDAVIEPLTWIEVDLGAIAFNYKEMQTLAKKHMRHPLGIMPVIKADAYGHGLLQVAQCLSQAHCPWVAVSNVSEGSMLRSAGFKGAILLFESTLVRDAKDIVGYGLTPTVCSLEMARALHLANQDADTPLPIHLKIDTGMGRLGVHLNEVNALWEYIHRSCPALRLEGVYTHFPVADSDKEFTLSQMRLFRDLILSWQNQGFNIEMIHAGNSMGLGDYPSDLFNVARPGIMLYGLYPSASLQSKFSLKPAMSVKTRIIYISSLKKGQGISYGHTFKASRDLTVAVLPIGYSNGYLRSLSNKAEVLIGGMRCPLIGRVTMDQIMVDVSALMKTSHPVLLNDEAVLLGRQGKEHISADDLAKWADTISYEIICSLGSRLPRVYLPS